MVVPQKMALQLEFLRTLIAKRFLKRRREFDCIIIGGNTARSERYAITPCPLVVISRHKSNVLITNPNAFWWNLEPVQALEKAKREFGPDVLIEAGSIPAT
jgi:hypothetical protein